MKGIDSYFSAKTSKSPNTENQAKSTKKKKPRAVISSSDDEPEISVTTDYKKKKMSESKTSEPKKMAVKTTTGDYFSSFGSMKKSSSKSKPDKNKENKKPDETIPEIIEKPKKRVLEIVDMPNEPETAPKPKKHKKSKSPKILKSDEIITLDSQPSQTSNLTPKPSKPTPKSMKVTSSTSKNPTKTPKKLTDKTKTPKSSETKKPVKPELTEEEKEEAKKLRSKNFRAFQNREAPKDIGKIPIPHGPMDALDEKMFCLSGVLEFITKEDFQDFIGRHGGVWKTSVTKKTDFLVKGRDAGQTKINKAQNGFTKVITGEDVVKMVQDKVVDDDDMDVDALEKSMAEGFDSDDNSQKDGKKQKSSQNSQNSQKSSQNDQQIEKSSKKSSKPAEKTSIMKTSKKLPESIKTPMIRQGLKVLEIKDDTPATTPLKKPTPNPGPADNTMMVDKYKPTEMKSIIGQTGAQSVANKLHAWLKDWRKNMQKMDFKGQTAKPQGANSFALKAALLSGPPGIGKTTTANLVAKSLGFAVVEYNASSVRSQKLLKSKLGVEISNSKIGVNSDDKCANKSVIIMDEVDGMSGNSDRGGVAVLIEFIKKSRLPIICICNDRGHAKVRSLSNHCFDLRVHRPKIDQVCGKMLQICFKENIKGITRPAMLKIVEGCNNDIRQVLHSLELIKASQHRGEMLDPSKMYDNAKELSEKVAKTSGLKNPFEDTRKIFSCSKQEYFKNHAPDLKEKKELFFNDYMMMPAWVFENYLSANAPSSRNTSNPFKNHNIAAANLSRQDVIGNKRMATQNWRLLTAESTNGVVIPGRVLCGGLSGGGWNGGLNFPGVWGKMSSMSKQQRLVGEVSCHTGKSMQCSSRSTFNMSYVSILNSQFVNKLKSGNVQSAVDLCLDYDMTKDDFDAIQEIGIWEKAPSDFSKIESKIKSGFTRAFKKGMLGHQYPFAVEGAVIKKSKKKDNVKIETVDSGAESEQSDDGGDDVDVSLFAKKAKTTAAKTAKTTKAKNSSAVKSKASKKSSKK